MSEVVGKKIKFMENIGGWIVIIIIVFIWLLPCFFVGHLAKKRGRSDWFWYIFSFIFTPILGVILVLLLGDTEKKRRQKILEDEELRRSYRNS